MPKKCMGFFNTTCLKYPDDLQGPEHKKPAY